MSTFEPTRLFTGEWVSADKPEKCFDRTIRISLGVNGQYISDVQARQIAAELMQALKVKGL